MSLRSLLLLALAGCKVGTDDGPAAGADTGRPVVDLTGTWTFTRTALIAKGACADDVGKRSTDAVTITHDLTTGAVDAVGLGEEDTDVLSGEFDGATFHVAGSYPEDGGRTVTDYRLELAETDAMTGGESWSWSNLAGDSTCPDGESDIDALRRSRR